jgi:carbonic anhydrase
MRRGNERFVAGVPEHPRQDVERRSELAGAQTPSAALFGCSDSRLSAEIIFDVGLGDLFVVRNAGQVLSRSAVGSLEYAVEVLGVSLIVVLAHDACGAVAAAIGTLDPESPPLPGQIRGLVEEIVLSIKRMPGVRRDDGSIDLARLDPAEVGHVHLLDTVGDLLDSSEIVSSAIAEGRLAIVGANYRLAEGRAVADVVVGDV